MKDYNPIDLSADFIDSRDIDARIEYLEEMQANHEDPEIEDTEPLDEDEQEELNALRALRDELSGYCSWEGGATLIADHYKAAYARDYAEDVGGEIPEWLENYIDWDKWADDFYDYDYTEATVELYGAEYTFTVRG